jgi:CRP/FNR family transcriptional regulator, cyclic AMP receptor protein
VQWRLLSGLPEADAQRVIESARRHHFDKGEVLVHEGDPGTSLYLLEEGRVAVRVATSGGEVATLAVVSAGEAFGEMALLRRSATRTASVVALEKVTALTLERDTFVRLCNEYPKVERLLVALLAGRVERLSNHLVEALYLPADKRVLRRLLELCRVYGSNGTGGTSGTSGGGVIVPLTQEDLAGLAGTTRPTVNLVLRALQEAGVLALSRGRVEVLDQRALELASR